ncbi:MAG: hypothetical protein ACTSRA_01290, partial [Promethearchaeota archaeon]
MLLLIDKAFDRLGSSWKLQVGLGIGINLIYLTLLFSHPTTRFNLYPPFRETRGNVWTGSDVMTYVEPAVSFLKYGTFERNGVPDYHRTIGYPLFLATLMTMFGNYWVEACWLVQAILFAAIYPSIAVVAREILCFDSRRIGILLVAYAAMGAGWTYTPVLLTDQPFAVALWGSMAAGIMAVKQERAPFFWWLLHFGL